MAHKKDYVADRRQFLGNGRKDPYSGWQILRWDEKTQAYHEGGPTFPSKRAASVYLAIERAEKVHHG